jgi:hypothetical protein
MTAVQEAPAAGRQERVSADLPGELAKRLRTWAALRGLPVSHVIAELVRRAVPTTDQLADQIRGDVRNEC